MYQVKIVKDINTAKKVGEFLTSKFAFEQTWAPNEKKLVLQAPLDSLSGKKHRYWYIEDHGSVIAALGVRENKYGSDGYEMDADYVAVHQDFRHLGLATMLLNEMEKFVIDNHGRYIHVLTCDIPSYAPARKFYEKHGYLMVGSMPDYYVPGEGRVDYFKAISK